MDIIKSIYDNDQDIITSIIKLHNNGKRIELDPTFSKGIIYKNIEAPIFKGDLYPQKPEILLMDSTKLFFSDNSIESILFDPPFLATKGKSLKENNESNKINKRFGVYATEIALHKMYSLSLQEFHRVLIGDGLLIFKCQDKVSSGKQYLSHVFIINKAIEFGFYCKDLFILTAKSRMTPEWQTRNQQHARKFHCYYLVFKKINKQIRYI